MAVTRIQDVIVPEVFTPYTVQRTMELSALIQSGIAVNSTEFTDFDKLASGSSSLINMPFWEDLNGDPEIMDDVGNTVPQKAKTGKDIARKIGFTKSFGANALAGHLAGDDPMKMIADRFGAYWNRQYQKTLLAELDGIFAATNMDEKVHDITAETGEKAVLSGETFLDATQKMGDAKDLLTGVMMNSNVETYLRKLDLLKEDEYLSQKGKPVYRFMGHRVIVDDSMAYDTETKAGEMYLFGKGAIAWGNGSDPKIKQTEIVRDGLSLAGEDILVNRRISILHPRGVAFTEESVAGTFPTFEEMAKGENWNRVYEPKAIRIVKFMFLLEAAGA